MPDGGPLTVAVDDTLSKRCGKKAFCAAWQHAGADTGIRPVGLGTCFVVVGLVVQLPLTVRPVCLPVLVRLWRPGQELSKVDLAPSLDAARSPRLRADLHLPGHCPPVRPDHARRPHHRHARQTLDTRHHLNTPATPRCLTPKTC
ncbi:hypothetical protein ACIBCO_39740 [Streptomyces violascens]|uniref:hypothetical protein n=1 Tax=Streptomyces violascens TaxID=67381 RepID=UPI0037B94E4D